MATPLHERDGYEESRGHPLVSALRELRERHDLTGAVLITFDGRSGRVGVDSSGRTPEFAAAMERLGDRLLQAIDDGRFDPE